MLFIQKDRKPRITRLWIQIDSHMVFQNVQRQLRTKKGSTVFPVKLMVEGDFPVQVIPGFSGQYLCRALL